MCRTAVRRIWGSESRPRCQSGLSAAVTDREGRRAVVRVCDLDDGGVPRRECCWAWVVPGEGARPNGGASPPLLPRSLRLEAQVRGFLGRDGHRYQDRDCPRPRGKRRQISHALGQGLGVQSRGQNCALGRQTVAGAAPLVHTRRVRVPESRQRRPGGVKPPRPWSSGAAVGTTAICWSQEGSPVDSSRLGRCHHLVLGEFVAPSPTVG